MRYINKAVFTNYLSCPTLGWLTKRNMLPKISRLSGEFLASDKKFIRGMSREFFSDAVSAWKSEADAAALHARKLIFDSDVKTICEICFVAGSYLAKIDIMQRLEGGGWHVFKVKSGGKCKVKYIRDISFDAMVLTKADMDVRKFTLLYLSNDYRLGMDISQLFKMQDCTEEAELKVQSFLSLSDKFFEDIESENMPKPYLKKACKNCVVFNTCMGRDVRNHIFDLPRLSAIAIEELIALNVDTIDKIPGDFKLTQMQEIVKNCVLTNATYVSENLKTELNSIKRPFYYLDFESVATMMPLYKDIAPHTQLLTQFSVHKTDGSGNILNHYEYIADQTEDCRREIAEKLIEYLDVEGSIITYANSERLAISKLGVLFPDLLEKLSEIIERIVDLELIVRKNYYDVNFHGRSSIKKILPVLVPEMDYSSLEIRDGGNASAAFAFMARGQYDGKKIEETKKNLLRYCAQDTLAMVRIHQFLINTVK